VVGLAELIYEPLGLFRLLHLALLVVLPERPGELVVVHGGTVLALTPKRGNPDRVDNLEDSLLSVQPVDAARVALWLQEELLEELPQHNVGAGSLLGAASVGS